jgi:N-acetylneuraminic acid mutarotase
MFDALLAVLERELQAALGAAVQGLVAMARTRLEDAVAEVAKDKAKGLAEVVEERAKSLAEVDVRREELGREVAAMHKYKEPQEGRVELNIGGYRFETSVQTLRRVPHTFFDVYFSGRYAQDVCADGSIFVDRDGEHFGHVLEYMRDGHLSVAEAGACPSVSLLRALKREFGFYCIELSSMLPLEPEQPDTAYVMGGYLRGIGSLSSMKRYNAGSNQWFAVAAMGTARNAFGACAIAGELYVTGGVFKGKNIACVEKYSPSSDTWSAVAPLPRARSYHASVTVGQCMYVLGGGLNHGVTSTVLKFDAIPGTWTELAPMPASRHSISTCAIESDIYVFGENNVDEEDQCFVFKYDTMTNAWSTLTPMPFHGCGLSLNVVDGMIYIVGDRSRDVRRYEPASGTYSLLAPMSTLRHFCTSFVLNGSLYVAGGLGNGNRSSVERYDIATDTWTDMADMLKERAFCGAATIQPVGPAQEQDLFDQLITQANKHRAF